MRGTLFDCAMSQKLLQTRRSLVGIYKSERLQWSLFNMLVKFCEVRSCTNRRERLF